MGYKSLLRPCKGVPKGLGQTLHAEKNGLAQNGEIHNRAIQKSAPGPCTRGTCTAACAKKCPQPSCSHAACQTLVHMGSRHAACHQAPWKTPPSRCAATHRVNGASPCAHPSFTPMVATPTWHGIPTTSTRRRAATKMRPRTNLVKNASTERVRPILIQARGTWGQHLRHAGMGHLLQAINPSGTRGARKGIR